MDNECIASWLKNIKEKYIHGGDESLDDTRKLAIDTAIERLQSQQAEIDRLIADKTKAFDYLFSKFAGHSNYHGDSILCAIEAVKEGKEIKTVKTMDKDGEQE